MRDALLRDALGWLAMRRTLRLRRLISHRPKRLIFSPGNRFERGRRRGAPAGESRLTRGRDLVDSHLEIQRLRGLSLCSGRGVCRQRHACLRNRAGSRCCRGVGRSYREFFPFSPASAPAEGADGTGSACAVGCATAGPPRSVARGRAAQPGSAGFCSGGLRQVDSCRAVERPGSEGQLLGAARTRRQRPRGAARPRRGGARAHRPGPR